MLRHRGSLSNPWEATHLTTTDSLSPSSRKSWVALSSMTLPFLAECARLDLAKVLCSYLQPPWALNVTNRSVMSKRRCLLLLFRTSDSHHLSTSSSVMVLQPWRKKLIKVVLFGDWEPHRHLFSAQWLNLKVFYSPWKGRIQAGRSLILQCRAEHQVSW